MKKDQQSYCSARLSAFVKNVGVLIFMMIILTIASLKAQSPAGNISVDVKNAKLSEAIKLVSRQAKMQFFYNADELDKNPRVTIALKNRDLETVLNTILKATNVTYTIDKGVVIFKVKALSSSGSPSLSKKKIRLTGKVVDTENKPLPGVTVEEVGTKNTTSSDENGNYILLADDNSAIRFQYIGFTAQVKNLNVPAATEFAVMNTTLKEAVQDLNSVVVTGYQNIAKRDFVGSIASIKMDEVKIGGINQVDKLLQGQLPGVMVANNSGLVGAKPRVRVRGTSTLLGNQEPVWVVDGIIQEDAIPFDYQQLNALSSATNTDQSSIKNMIGSSVAFLNVDDIEDVTVLKDAASTAIYGVKAANGVIVITTKKGKAGKAAINYSTNLTSAAKPNYGQFNLMNSKERIGVSKEIYEKGLQFGVSPDPVSYEGLALDLFDKKITQEQFGSSVNKLETNNTDWFDLLFQAPFSQSHSLSVSGGSDRTTFYGSIGYLNDRGNTKGNEQDRYTASVNINSSLSDRLRVGIKLNGSRSTTQGFYQVDPFKYAYNTSRTIAATNDDGSPFFYTAPNTGAGAFKYNVLNELATTGNTNKLTSVNMAANVEYKFLTDFTFQSLLGYGYNQTNGNTFATEQSNVITQLRGYEYGSALPNSALYLASRIPNGGLYNDLAMQNQAVTFRNTISYNKRLRANKDGLTVMAGQELRSSKFEGMSKANYGYMPDRGKSFAQIPLTYYTLANATLAVVNDLYAQTIPTITDRLSNYISYFATASYNLNQKYVFNANIRTDASNRFGQYANHRFLPVWSIGGKWNIAEEKWFENWTWLNQLSTRVSYGFQGNVAENFSPDLIAQIPTGSAAINPITGDPTLQVRSLAYKDLRWERNQTLNLGVDFALFKNRVSGTVEYFVKNGYDVIVQKPIPLEYGLLTMPINAGDVNNKGYEIAINVVPIRKPNFDWTIGFNTSKVINDVKRSGSISLTSWQTAVSGGLYKEGYPATGIWSFDFAGLNAQTGTPMFNGLNAATNPAAITDITNALVYSGQIDPKFTGGISNNIRYKSFTLNAFLYLSTGNVKRLAPLYPNARDASSAPYPFQNLSAELNNRWRQPGDEAFTNIPSLPSAGSVANTTITIPGSTAGAFPRTLYDYSNERVVDASFARLRNLALGYLLPNEQSKKLGLKSFQMQASVSNLFYIADKRLNGTDPEVNGNSLPLPRIYALTLNIGI